VKTTAGRFDRSVGIWIDAALKRMDTPGLVGKLSWVWNPQLTSTMGRANSLILMNFLGTGVHWHMPTTVEFSPELFERGTITQRRETVYHEVAHAVDMFRGTYNPRRPHGKSWKNLMEMAGVPAVRCHDVPIVRRR